MLRFSGSALTALLLAMVLALGALNIATLLSESVHRALFGVAERALLVFGAKTAEQLTRRSLTKASESQVRRATEELVQENRKAMSKTEQLLAENAEWRAKHARLAVEADVIKGKHAKATAELVELTAKRAADASTAKRVASSVRNRLATGVSRNVGAIPAEAVPYIGLGITLSVTALDIYDACQTTREINELLKLLGQGEENADFCGTKLPTVPEAIGRMKAEWRSTAERVASEARAASTRVPVPEVRVPSVQDARAVICPVVAGAAWLSCP